MKGTVLSNVTNGLNIRDITDPSKILGKIYYNTLLKKGDVVYGEVKTDNRIYFQRIYRANGTVDQLAGSSITKEGTSVYMSLVAGTEPSPTPDPEPAPLKPLKITFESDQYETMIVELKPKA